MFGGGGVAMCGFLCGGKGEEDGGGEEFVCGFDGGGARAVTASPGRVISRVSSLAVVTGSVWWSSDGGEEKGNPGLSAAHLVESLSSARVCQKDPV